MNKNRKGFRKAFENFMREIDDKPTKVTLILYPDGTYRIRQIESELRSYSLVIAISANEAQMRANLEEALRGE